MAVSTTLAYSLNGEYFAHSSADGTLKLWDTTTGTLKQAYTPSSHLSATCTCLAWGSLRISRKHHDGQKRKKCRLSSAQDDVETVELIAMGTVSGHVLIYNVGKGDVERKLSGGHDEAVNDVCWQSRHEFLFTCSNDRHIVQWCLATGTVKARWKADKGAVHSICLCSSDQHMLSAGRSIKLWDLPRKQVLKTFAGHATEVFRLQHLSCLDCHAIEDQSRVDEQIDASYFLSAARDDRIINAWQVNLATRDTSSLASFILPDEPVFMQVSRSTKDGQPCLLLAVTKGGLLIIYEHTLNGRCKKPVKPRVTVQVVAEGGAAALPRPISIICAVVVDGDERSIMLAYGSSLNPTFEKLMYSNLEPTTCLIRSEAAKSTIYTQQQVSMLKTPAVSDNVMVLAPSHMVPGRPAQRDADKRKRKGSVEMTMDERLQAISLDRGEDGEKKRMPKADTLATLLTQGLQSNNNRILCSVLYQTDATVIDQTVRRLPVLLIIPLLQQLTTRMSGQSSIGHMIVKWLRSLLTTHASYLMMFPELMGKLGDLHQQMDSRVSAFGRLTRLQGKLDLMLSQLSAQHQGDESIASQQPICSFCDVSSDEDTEMEGIFPDASDSEDDWAKGSVNGKTSENEEEEEDEAEDDDDDDDETMDEDEADNNKMTDDEEASEDA